MYHWNDRYYESPNCAECGEYVMAKTIAELETLMAEHACAFVIE
jgi:formylmethanofuran dehydrogenase subunit E